MRLTNAIREAFIRAALDDVPSVDYTSMKSKAALDDSISQLPKEAATAYKKHPEFFKREGQHIDQCGYYYGIWGNNRPSQKLMKTILELERLNNAQYKQERELRDSLHGVAYSVTTRKALAELLPEFEKYLPPENAPNSRLMPTVANVLTDFVKAGWPKQNAGKIAAAKAAA